MVDFKLIETLLYKRETITIEGDFLIGNETL